MSLFHTWWLIPLSKWVTSLVIGGFRRLIPYLWDPWDAIYGCAVPGSNCSEALDGILGTAIEHAIPAADFSHAILKEWKRPPKMEFLNG